MVDMAIRLVDTFGFAEALSLVLIRIERANDQRRAGDARTLQRIADYIRQSEVK